MTTVPKTTPADWLAGARPKTLPAAVVPVAVGAGAALGTDSADVVWWRVTLALAVSLLLQIGVNFANDYSDGVRGTDDGRVGPLRLVATGRAAPGAVKRAALGALAAAAVAGLVLAATTSWWLLAIGATALLAAWGYTGGPRPYGYAGLGELFVFVYFGLVATVGTAYVAIESVPGVTWPAAIAVGSLACALLVVNNLRDIPTDSVAGKRTLAVRLGDRMTRWLYAALLAAAFVGVAIAAASRPWSLVALAALPVSAVPARAVLGGAAGRDLIRVLEGTARSQLAVGALLAIGLAVS